MNPKTKIHEAVASLLKKHGDKAELRDADSLVLSGRVDSLTVMEIAGYLEQELGVDFERFGFDPVDFDSVDSIMVMVERARARR